MKHSSAKSRRLGWLVNVRVWDGMQKVADAFRLRLRRWLRGLCDVDPFTPAPRKKRGFWPYFERLETRLVPSISVSGSAPPAGVAGLPTGYAALASFIDTNGFKGASAYTATVAWGDGSSNSTGGIDGTGHVYAQHTYAAAGTYSVTVTVTGDGGSGNTTLSAHITQGPTHGNLPVVTAQASPLLTGLPVITLPVLGSSSDPAYSIVFNGNSVAVDPIGQYFDGSTTPLPSSISVQLTWNGNTQSAVSFNTTGHSAGDALLMNVQLSGFVTATGEYSWAVNGGSPPEVKITVSSSSEGVRAGNGWTFAGVNRLIPVTDGVIWKDDQGFGRFFANASSTSGGGMTYNSPAGDFGTLVENSGGSFTYTGKGGLVTDNFNSSGLETSSVTADGQATTFSYSGVKLTGIETPDGRFVTLTYDGSGNLQTEQGPLGTATFTHDASGNLTGVERPDTSLYTYSYDSDGRMTVEQRPDASTTYSYDSHGLLTSVNKGLSETETVQPVLATGWSSTAAYLSSAVGVTTDALSNSTTVTLDNNYNVELVQNPNGSQTNVESNGNYQPTAAGNADFQVISLGYNASGDNTNITAPNGGTTSVTYDSTLHEPTSIEDPLTNRTTMTYSGTGDLLTTKDPTGGITTNTWSGGLMQTTTNPLNLTTSYVYDSNNNLIAVIAPTGLRTSYTYDAAGDQTSVEQPDGTITTTLYDAMGRPTGTINPDGSRTTTVYDGNGNIIQQSDVRGNWTTYVYDSAGRQVATIDPLGNRTTTVYDNAGNVIANVDQYGNRTSYVYDSQNRQIAVEDQYGHFTTTIYDAGGNVIATENMYGQFTSYTYDGDGNKISTEDPYGNVTTSVYNAADQLTATVDPYGNRTTYIYDTAGRQIATEDRYGHFSTTIYDSAGNVSARVDVYGNRTTNIYDSYGRQSATEDQYGHFTTTIYDSYGRVSATVDIYNHATTTTYDAYGRVQSTLDALGNTTTYLYDSYGEQVGVQTSLGITTSVYDSYGRVQATEDPLSNFTTTVYDSNGRVQATVDALGNRTTYIFDSLGRPSATENALGNFTTTIYDTYGRVAATEDARSNFTTTIYDSFGRVSATENALGKFTTTIYDSLGRVSATENALSNFTTTIYDSLGRVSATEDGRSHFTTTIYDSYGRVSATEDALGTFTTAIYDSLGRVSATEDARSHFVTTIYDSYGRVAATEDQLSHYTSTIYDSYGRQVATEDALTNITTSVLDSFGRQVNLIDASNNKTTFVYDALGRVVNEVSPTAGVTTMVYDGDGRLTSQTSPTGTKITYAYDAIGENTAQTWYNADGTVNARLTFTYDAAGNQLTAANAQGTYTMAYDAANEVTSVQGLWSTVLTFTYDAIGERATMQDNFSGLTSYSYDADGNLTQEEFGGTGQTPMRINLGYDADNRLTSETRYSDLAGTTTVATTSLTYDSNGNVTGQLDISGGGTTIAYYTNVYDNANRITSEDLNGTTVNYTYDADNELTGDSHVTPTYDSTGNRTGTGYTVSTGNEVTDDPNDVYSYDSAGEETKDVITTGANAGNTWVYAYDPKGELVQAQLWTKDPAVYSTGNPEIEEVDYKYDAFGNLVERDAYPVGMGSPTVTRNAVDGWDPALAGATGQSNFNVWADLNSSNALQTRYFHGDQVDQLFGRQDSLVAYWYLTDRLGSVRDVLDNSGNVKDAINYDGWGNIVSETNSTYRGTYAWTGRQIDVETDLQYNRARWYDPATGRWQTQDPLGFAAGDSNVYRYGHNGPTCLTDSSGLAETWLGTIAGIAGSVISPPVGSTYGVVGDVFSNLLWPVPGFSVTSITINTKGNAFLNNAQLGPVISVNQFAFAFQVTVSGKGWSGGTIANGKYSQKTFELLKMTKNDGTWDGIVLSMAGSLLDPNTGKVTPTAVWSNNKTGVAIYQSNLADWQQNTPAFWSLLVPENDNTNLFNPASKFVNPNNPNGDLQWVDAPGYPATWGGLNEPAWPAAGYTQFEYRMGAWIQATGTDNVTKNAKIWVTMFGTNDNGTWKLNGNPTVNVNNS